MLALDPPKHLSPSDLSSATSSKIIWEKPSYEVYQNDSYRIQVDNNSDFSTPEKDYKTENTFYTPTLDLGTWHWRLKAKDSSQNWSDWSTPWSFNLTTATPTPQPSVTSTPSPNTPSPTPQPTPTKPPSYFNITNTPSKINSNQSFGIPVSLQLPDNPNTKFYLKGAFQKVGSTNYFGQTKVDNNWIKNLSSYSSQKSIQTDSNGQWSGNLEIQPDISDSGYQGTGVYVFKVARYTSTGSGPTWSNDANIEIIGESQTFSPTPQPSTETQASESPIINTSKNQTAQIPEYIKSENILSATYAPSPSLQPEINIAEDKSINWYFVLAGITGLFTLSVLIYFLKAKKFDKLLKHDL